MTRLDPPAPYSREMHVTAVRAISELQAARPDSIEDDVPAPMVGLVPVSDDDYRVWESMAPENTGTRRERYDTLLNRTRLAAVASRALHRQLEREQWLDEQDTP